MINIIIHYYLTRLLDETPLEESINELLAISSYWFELGLIRNINFNFKLTTKLLNNVQNLNKTQFLYLMFLLNIRRTIYNNEVKSVLTYVDSLISEKNLTLNELSIISIGLFKTQTKVSYDTLENIIHFCLDHLGDKSSKFLYNYNLVSILKLIRFSFENLHVDCRILYMDLKTMIEIIITQKHLSFIYDSAICLTHLLLLMNYGFLYTNKILYKTIFDIMIKKLDKFRIKDIDRILLCLSNASFFCPKYKLSILEVYLCTRRKSEINNYPFILYNIIYYLLLLDYFPQKLLKLCNGDFLKKALGKQ